MCTVLGASRLADSQHHSLIIGDSVPRDAQSAFADATAGGYAGRSDNWHYV